MAMYKIPSYKSDGTIFTGFQMIDIYFTVGTTEEVISHPEVHNYKGL